MNWAEVKLHHSAGKSYGIFKTKRKNNGFEVAYKDTLALCRIVSSENKGIMFGDRHADEYSDICNTYFSFDASAICFWGHCLEQFCIIRGTRPSWLLNPSSPH